MAGCNSIGLARTAPYDTLVAELTRMKVANESALIDPRGGIHEQD